MKERTITVTEAARHFADCVNRAHYQRTTFVLLKNGKPFARIEPDHEKRCTGGSPLHRFLASTAGSFMGSNLGRMAWMMARLTRYAEAAIPNGMA